VWNREGNRTEIEAPKPGSIRSLLQNGCEQIKRVQLVPKEIIDCFSLLTYDFNQMIFKKYDGLASSVVLILYLIHRKLHRVSSFLWKWRENDLDS
jgi:hypothetical protein